MGGPFSANAATGETYTGAVALLIPQRELFAVVPHLADAQFRLSTHRACGQTGVLAWLAVWGPPRPEVERFQASAQKILGALFTS